MDLLGATYESARINIPLKLFAARRTVKPWGELDESVRTEIAQLVRRVRSVLRTGEMQLSSYARVVAEFNRGVRDGFFSAADGQGKSMVGTPYDWGYVLGEQSNERRSADPAAVKQFITATHLLGYEFSQLDQVAAGAYEFLVRNVGPQRADELGPLAFALPVLINYRRAEVQRILDDVNFSLFEYQINQSPAPTHLEYLTQGIAALFDCSPESWIRVAASMTLASQPFADGTRLQDEHFQAPEQAAQAVLATPIAACHAVQRQLARVHLARAWLIDDTRDMHIERETASAVTLWHVWQGTPGSRIRSGEAFVGDVVAGNVIYLVSRYYESVIPPDQTGFQFLRRNFNAFARGFDSRVEGVVDPRALACAARGRAVSAGIRRFVNGGPLIAHVSAHLQALAATLNELHHALVNPVEFMLEQLQDNQETPLAAVLMQLFRSYESLPRHLFAENAHFELFSMTHVKTQSGFDLLRSALYQVVQSVSPHVDSADEAMLLRSRARQDLQRILRTEQARLAAEQSDSQAVAPVGEAQRRLVEAALLFDEEFDTLLRLMRRLVRRLHHARVLGKPQPAREVGDLTSTGLTSTGRSSIDAA